MRKGGWGDKAKAETKRNLSPLPPAQGRPQTAQKKSPRFVYGRFQTTHIDFFTGIFLSSFLWCEVWRWVRSLAVHKKFGGGEKFGGVQGGLISDLKVTYSDLEVLLSPLPVLVLLCFGLLLLCFGLLLLCFGLLLLCFGLLLLCFGLLLLCLGLLLLCVGSF